MAEISGAPAHTTAGQKLLVALAWIYVGIPLAWGVTQTVLKSIALFK
jgi:hypothetical protein